MPPMRRRSDIELAATDAPPPPSAHKAWLRFGAIAPVGAALFSVALGSGQAQRAALARSGPADPQVVFTTKDFDYMPSRLEVHAGDAVLFKNGDQIAHTFTATDKSFDSGDMPQGATWKHAFVRPGTYAYTCAYHSYMKGSIVVKP